MNEKLKSSGKQVLIAYQRRWMERVEAQHKSFINENIASQFLPLFAFPGSNVDDVVMEFFLHSTESGVTDEERRLILEEHNYLRQTVATGHVPGQPAAQNMQEMHWDDELAAKAQQWANECTFQHDPSRYLGKFKHSRLLQDTVHNENPVNSKPFSAVYWWSFNWN